MDNSWYSKPLKPYAQELRRNMTPEEKHLWYDFLKSLDVTVKRQKIIGPYIADFYVPKAKLVIELDGSQHFTAEGHEYDEERNRYMKSCGITVVRYSNLDVSNHFSEVCEDISRIIKANLSPSPHGEGASAEADEVSHCGGRKTF